MYVFAADALRNNMSWDQVAEATHTTPANARKVFSAVGGVAKSESANSSVSKMLRGRVKKKSSNEGN
jgi:hypothetical protein